MIKEEKRAIVQDFVSCMTEEWIGSRIESTLRMNDLIESCLNPRKTRDATIIMLHLNTLAGPLLNLHCKNTISHSLQSCTGKFEICALILDELEMLTLMCCEEDSETHYAISQIGKLYSKFDSYV